MSHRTSIATRTLPRLAAAAAFGFAVSAQALTLQGPAYIAPSTSLPTCGGICGPYGKDILQIADGDVSNLNGWAGDENVVGIIKLDLHGNYDLTSFSLWNDINIVREGVGDFRLNFYGPADQLIGTSAIYTAPIGQFAAGVYSFASVHNVSRVDLDVLTLLTGGSCCRIEIREVAFEGDVVVVPEPSTWALTALGLGALGLMSRRRRSQR